MLFEIYSFTLSGNELNSLVRASEILFNKVGVTLLDKVWKIKSCLLLTR